MLTRVDAPAGHVLFVKKLHTEIMNPIDDTMLSAALLAEVEALAAVENRSAHEMLREAVERYVADRRGLIASDGAKTNRRMALDAAKRILDRRSSHPLPAGANIRDLMTFGRA